MGIFDDQLDFCPKMGKLFQKEKRK